ncbi:hypothetical protein [Pseudanabaena sp. FACHB-2040]|uniref:hypothetical protein n=1 Tax=Pseudanabaena sp. FACHB-2040 TaxID=2692859 RepID=UPI00168713A9|nr:hypothetical protein [Pseudanabaena sp. FACHB-2040]MBD2260549.1 hypothetical protein [Pseudanabaena sp. FACHB-2040]
MNVPLKTHFRKARLLSSLVAGCLLFSSAIAGCTSPNSQQHTDTAASTATDVAAPSVAGIQQWAVILKGETVHGLTFTDDGQLLYQEKPLLNEIPVSYVSDGTDTYAQQLIVSDPSPSGRFNIVKACEGSADEAGLCWAVFLVDRQAETAEKISIAKYGGQDWVQWSADERYAVFAESMEGVTWFVALDLQTGDSQMFDQMLAAIDLSSFTWLSDRTLQVNVSCDSDCAETQFQGDIAALFSQ